MIQSQQVGVLIFLLYKSKISISENYPSFASSPEYAKGHVRANMNTFEVLRKWNLPEGEKKRKKHVISSVFSEEDSMFFHI